MKSIKTEKEKMKRRCIICGKGFEVYNKPKKTSHMGRTKQIGISKRRYDCKTCSPECSKKYQKQRQLKGWKEPICQK